MYTGILHRKSVILITVVLYNIIKKLSGTYLFKYLDIQILLSTKILSKPVLIVETGLGMSSDRVLTEKVPRRPAGPGQ